MPLRIPYNQLPNLGALDSGDIIPGIRPAFDEGSLTVGDLTSFVNPGKVYRADMSQSGGSDPVVNYEYENWIGNIVWTYISLGTYNGFLTGAFTGYVINSGRCFNDGRDSPNYYYISKIDDDNIKLIVTNRSFSISDSLLVNTFIEVIVYPAAP